MAQMTLDGFAAPIPRERLFFALFPARSARAAIAEEAERLRRTYVFRGKSIAVERYHVTLQFLGDYPELQPSLIANATRAAQSVSCPVFDFALDAAASFRGGHRHPFVLKCTDQAAPLQRLWKQLFDALTAHGFRNLDRRLVPHVTLLYDDRLRIEPMPIEPIRWTVHEFALVHSALGQAKYQVLGTWPLADR